MKIDVTQSDLNRIIEHLATELDGMKSAPYANLNREQAARATGIEKTIYEKYMVSIPRLERIVADLKTKQIKILYRIVLPHHLDADDAAHLASAQNAGPGRHLRVTHSRHDQATRSLTSAFLLVYEGPADATEDDLIEAATAIDFSEPPAWADLPQDAPFVTERQTVWVLRMRTDSRETVDISTHKTRRSAEKGRAQHAQAHGRQERDYVIEEEKVVDVEVTSGPFTEPKDTDMPCILIDRYKNEWWIDQDGDLLPWESDVPPPYEHQRRLVDADFRADSNAKLQAAIDASIHE